MKRQQFEDISLVPGQVLTVTTDASSTASVVPMGDNPGLPPGTPVAMPVSTTMKFGPFPVAKRYKVIGVTGDNISFATGLPAATASIRILSATLTPVAVAANISAEQTFTVTGVTAQDLVAAVSGPNLGNATFLADARVVGADQIAVRFGNPTAGSLTPAAGVYSFLVAH